MMPTNAYRYYLLIFLACVLVNWPIFISDVLVNDDLTIVTSNLLEDYTGMRSAFYDLAKPSGYYFHRALASFTPNGTFPYRLYNFAFIFATAIVVFNIATYSMGLNRKTAMAVSLGLLSFPSIGIQAFAIGTVHFFSYFLFYFGLLLVYRFWIGKLGWLGLFGGCLALGIAFRGSSLIPFLFVFLFLFLLSEFIKRKEETDFQQNSLIKGIWLTLLLTLIAIFVFFIERIFYEQYSYFAGSYNLIRFEPAKLFHNMIDGIDGTYISRFTDIISWPIERLLIIAVSSCIILLFACKVGGGQSNGQADKGRRLFLLVAVILSVCVAILPYALVDKVPKAEGYQSRWAMLVGIGGAFTLGLLYEMTRTSSYKVIRRIGEATTVFLLCAFTTTIWDHYGKWERVSIDNTVIIGKLKALEYNPNIHFYCVDTSIHSEQFYERRWYDWGYVFDQSWNTNREVMGYHIDNCKRRKLYIDGKLKSHVPLIELVAASVDDMKQLSNWMYYGKSRAYYNLGSIRIITQDTRIDELSGTQLVFESLRLKFFGSEILQSYDDNMVVSYD